jgi:hypothetical protein
VTDRLGSNTDYQRGWVDGTRWQRLRIAELRADPATKELLERLLAEDDLEIEVLR